MSIRLTEYDPHFSTSLFSRLRCMSRKSSPNTCPINNPHYAPEGVDVSGGGGAAWKGLSWDARKSTVINFGLTKRDDDMGRYDDLGKKAAMRRNMMLDLLDEFANSVEGYQILAAPEYTTNRISYQGYTSKKNSFYSRLEDLLKKMLPDSYLSLRECMKVEAKVIGFMRKVVSSYSAYHTKKELSGERFDAYKDNLIGLENFMSHYFTPNFRKYFSCDILSAKSLLAERARADIKLIFDNSLNGFDLVSDNDTLMNIADGIFMHLSEHALQSTVLIKRSKEEGKAMLLVASYDGAVDPDASLSKNKSVSVFLGRWNGASIIHDGRSQDGNHNMFIVRLPSLDRILTTQI